ncbi:MAG TPA: methyltransferase domain-containing protein [Victivallales bacterium]|nr:methyltransferase domain-containing protein [Victivallales bacterium]
MDSKTLWFLRRTNPISTLTAAIETCKRIYEQGGFIENKVFLEVGTGRTLMLPMAYWLMGAEKTITIDLNPYLKSELVEEEIKYIYENQKEILNLFGSLIKKERFKELVKLIRNFHFSLQKILDFCSIEYIAPGDAANTLLPDNSIDFHTSYTVLEHIPIEVLERILKEGNRIIKNQGLFVHRIDYSDHFSHSDKSISPINFLQYSEKQWCKFAGNRYMYMNRLRHDDFLNLFESVGQTIISVQPDIDQKLYELLSNSDFKLDEKFKSKHKDILVIIGAWIISKKNC